MPFTDVCVCMMNFLEMGVQARLEPYLLSIEMCYPSLHISGNSSFFLFKSPAAMMILIPWTLLLQTIVHTMVGQPSHGLLTFTASSAFIFLKTHLKVCISTS